MAGSGSGDWLGLIKGYVKDGGIVRARARYAGDNSELGYTLTDKTAFG